MDFTAELELSGRTATGIAVPPEVVAGLGAGKRIPVVVTVNKHSYRTTIAPYQGAFMIPVSAENREAAGIVAGEQVRVSVTVDSAPRSVEVPDDLRDALAASPKAREFFESLSFSNQRGYVDWVTSAKKEETRNSRVAASVEALAAGRKQH